METNGLFIQKLNDLQKICDLQKLLDLKNYGSMAKNAEYSSPGAPVYHKQDKIHVVTSAAMSYWRSDKAPIQSRANKSPAPAIAIKTLPPLHLR